MAKQDWDDARWLWWLALLGGISYFYAVQQGLSGLTISFWKSSGVGLLALWAWRNSRGAGQNGPAREMGWMAAILAFGAAGDFLLAEFGLVVGGLVFAMGHFIAIGFYLRHRRQKFTFSQRLLAWLVTPLALIIAWQLTRQSPSNLAAAALGYTAIVALMMAAAWISIFPRYITGLGAFSFLISDLFIFAGEGGVLPKSTTALLVWPLYFGGQALIAWGVISTLARRKQEKFG